MTATCPDCGDEFDSEHGVSIHQSQSGCGSDGSESEWTDFEQDVVEREGGVCKNCGDDPVENVHEIDPEPNAETKIVNYAGLCDGCNEEIANLAPPVKRTLIQRGGEDESDPDERTPWYERDPYVSGRGPRSGPPGDG